MASRSPAWRVAFSTNRKAMDLPSGDHSSELMAPGRWLTCFSSLVAGVQTKMLSCESDCQFPLLEEQPERKASCLPSGDQAGWEAAHAPGVLLETLRMVSGERMRPPELLGVEPAGAMGVRCSSEPSDPLNAQARVLPSGEMETEDGIRTRARSSRSEAMRESSVLAVGV